MPTRIAWLTDTHLDFVDPDSAIPLLHDLEHRDPDAVVITGDIAVSRNVRGCLEAIAQAAACPVYFVLGNHDYYGSSLQAVRSEMARGFQVEGLHYLSAGGVVQLGRQVALLGHDGWADGRNGDYANTRLELTDFRLIADFVGLYRWGCYRVMERLADEAAAHFERLLPGAAANNRRVIVATHVPPFAEAAFYQGRPSSPDALPFFSSRSVGETLLRIAAEHPSCHLTVLCGHTHGGGTYRPVPNLEVRVGGADYGSPRIEDVLVVGG